VEEILITLTGSIVRVVHRTFDTGFCVLRASIDGVEQTVVGLSLETCIREGDVFDAGGGWSDDKKYGHRFKASTLTFRTRTQPEQILAYLSSGAIPGIGPGIAARLVCTFGENTMEVLENEPQKVARIKGIGADRAAKIRAAMVDQSARRDLELFLVGLGFSVQKAIKVFRKLGVDALTLIKANPYVLCREVDGVGFAAADAVGTHLGIGKNDPRRVRAGVVHALESAMVSGHTCMPSAQLPKAAAKLLGCEESAAIAAAEDLRNQQEVIEETLGGRALTYLRKVRLQEHSVAQGLARRMALGSTAYAPREPAELLATIEKGDSMTLSDEQRHAVITAMCNRVTIITGGPGVGKTSIIAFLVRCMKHQHLGVRLAAPTGRAAKRMTEATGHEASTIHRMLGWNPHSNSFLHDDRNPISGDCFIIDETSMLDLPLTYFLLRAIPESASLVFVGDIDQLPSIGPGSILSDLIHSQKVPVCHLKQVFRQALSSRIISNAHRINQGLLPESSPKGTHSDYYFIEESDPERIKCLIVTLLLQRIPKVFGLDPLRDVQIVTPMNKGPLGTVTLNSFLQDLFVPGTGRLRIGDKVMQIANNYDRLVFNGDTGFVTGVTADNVVVDFEGRPVEYPTGEASEELRLAYAATTHKLQGCEYPAIIFVMTADHAPMLQKNLLYTGITRGKRLVVLLGELTAIRRAVGNNRCNERWTSLRERIVIACT